MLLNLLDMRCSSLLRLRALLPCGSALVRGLQTATATKEQICPAFNMHACPQTMSPTRPLSCDWPAAGRAGSDDGRVFIFCARTGALVVALQADDDVANSVAPHPSLPVLATSGIESAVRLWAPRGPVQRPDLRQEVSANQARVLQGFQGSTSSNMRKHHSDGI